MIISFPFYISDWRDSSARIELSTAEKLLYLELLIWCWKDGYLPTSEDALVTISGMKLREFRACWPKVKAQFFLKDGRYHHHKVDEKRPALEEWRGARIEAGRRGGRASAKAKAIAKAIATPKAEAIAQAIAQANGKLQLKPPSSSSSSSSSSGGEESLSGLQTADVSPPYSPPLDEPEAPAVQNIRAMLVEFTSGALGEPDQAVCLKLLHFAKGEPERIEAWLRTKVGKRKTIQTWGWFLQVAEAELRDSPPPKPAPICPPADNVLQFDSSADFQAVVAQLAAGKGMA